MPHRCMNCGKTYEDESEELITGCECGSSLFMYEKEEEQVTEKEREEVKANVEDMMEEGISQKENIKLQFDLDSIIVEEEGVYKINVSRLLDEIPLVIRKTEGVYHVNLPSAFKPENSKLDLEELDTK